MELSTPLLMMGAPGSPYTRKMRSRCCATGGSRSRLHPAELDRRPSSCRERGVPLLPTFYLPDESGEIPCLRDRLDTADPPLRAGVRWDARSFPGDPAVGVSSTSCWKTTRTNG